MEQKRDSSLFDDRQSMITNKQQELLTQINDNNNSNFDQNKTTVRMTLKQSRDIASSLASRAGVVGNQIKLKNYLNGTQSMDTLHVEASNNSGVGQNCSQNCCAGALMNPESAFGVTNFKPIAPKVTSHCPMFNNSNDSYTTIVSDEGYSELSTQKTTTTTTLSESTGEEFIRSNQEVLEHAIKFLDQYYSSIKKQNTQAHRARIDEVAEQIRLTSTYHLLKSELVYGAKLAWRNTARCIGRIQWNKLQVFDARLTTTAQEMFEAICTHIRYATNKGNIRSAITIFPRRVKSVKHDYRVWNNQLIGYAGYRIEGTGDDEILGDPINVEITQLCEKLGWQGARTRFDILPLVLSASGGLPQVFSLPEDIVLRVKLHHPQFDWFSKLNLEWYAVPAVSNMMLDVGGLQFPAAPFNGWYMGTEIGTRDLCDASRYNVLGEVAEWMNLNTSSNLNLWKDKALVEVNTAVLYSFQQANVTIVDHHTASETFMTHMHNEQKLRGGCPADWVWIVPPTSASTTEVFHQEMINYHLLPNYEYQAPAWKTFDWAGALADASGVQLSQDLEMGSSSVDCLLALAGVYQQQDSGSSNKTRTGLLRRYRFRDAAVAVQFSCRLYIKMMAQRAKCSIVFATETGKSEKYANKLEQLFSKSFNVKLQSMDQWSWQTPTQLLLVVASTFGNGEPPENGETFARSLKTMIKNKTPTQLTSSLEDGATISQKRSSSASRDKTEQVITEINSIRYAVFALGSTSYPNFCAFGKSVDGWLEQMGANKMLNCECGDEMSGQEKKFDEWTKRVYESACNTFNIVACDTIDKSEDKRKWSPTDVKFIPLALGPIQNQANKDAAALNNLINLTNNKRITTFTVENRLNCSQDMRTISVQLTTNNLNNGTSTKHLYEPGDHVAVYPLNSKELVDGILDRMKRDDNQMDPDQVFKILVRRNDNNNNNSSSNKLAQPSLGRSVIDEIYIANNQAGVTKKHSVVSATSGYHSESYRENFSDGGSIINDSASVITNSNDQDQFDQSSSSGSSSIIINQLPSQSMSTSSNIGSNAACNTWVPHDSLPSTSLREALCRYLDISSGPSQDFLAILSQFAQSSKDKKKLLKLATQSSLYEQWKSDNCPNLLHVLNEFKSIVFKATLLTQLPLIQPRFYSISSSPFSNNSQSTPASDNNNKTQITLTLGLVSYTTKMGQSREGVCSNYLNRVDLGDTIYGYVRSASSFHVPHTSTAENCPLILVAAGTGLAPFRSFWEHKWKSSGLKSNIGDIYLYFGCRDPESLLYQDEIDNMLDSNIINGFYVAHSRVASRPKQYVQDKLEENATIIRKQLFEMGAHVYVCGDVAMAEGVYKTLNSLLSSEGQSNDDKLISLREQNRYHEDIFGARPIVASTQKTL